MFNLTVSATIKAPINCVFDYMSTPENNSKWQRGTLETVTMTNGRNKMAVYFRSIGHFLGRRNMGIYQVIETNSNRKYRFKSLSGPLHLHTAYTFDTVDDDTNVKVSIHVGTTKFFHIYEKELEKKMEQQLMENLTTLKAILEVKQIPHTSEMDALVI